MLNERHPHKHIGYKYIIELVQKFQENEAMHNNTFTLNPTTSLREKYKFLPYKTK